MIFVFRQLLSALRGRLWRIESYVHRRVRRVGLSEIDLNLHMNQRVYAAIAELSRAEWFMATRLWDTWRADGLNPMVAEQRITYRRELKPFARYTIDTRPVAVDGRFLTLQQWFLVGDRAHTRVDVKLLFVGPDGVLSPEAVTALIQPIVQEPLAVVDWRVVAR